jgi:hypothetical protein
LKAFVNKSSLNEAKHDQSAITAALPGGNGHEITR